MRQRKRTAVWLFCMLFIIAAGVWSGGSRALAGWIETPEFRFMEEDGSFKKEEWYQSESGDWYYFDENGRMATGFYRFGDGRTFFFNSDGARETGLIRVDGRAYFFDENGVMAVGKAVVNGTQYEFTAEGLLDPSIRVPAVKWYALEDGVIPERNRHFNANGSESFHLPAWGMLALGLLLLTAGRKRQDRAELFFLYTAVLFASAPLFLPYLIRGHDMRFHLNRILGIRDSLEQGMFPVRLNSFSFNGFGYGEPVFYPNLFVYIPALLMKAGIPMVGAVQLWLMLCNAGTAAIMYFSAGRLFRSRTAGCFCSILYTLGIYRLGNCYTRAAYGELLAMMFLPLVIYGFYEVFFGKEKNWKLLTIGLTGVVQSHIISAVLTAALCTAGGLVCIRRILSRERFAALTKALVFTICLNLWFLIPLVDYMGAGLNLDALQFQADKCALTLSKLLELFPIAMGATPSIDYGARDSMALTLGFPVLAAAGLLMFQWIQQKKEGAGEQGEKEDGNGRAAHAAWRLALLFLLIGSAAAFASLALFPWKYLMQFGWFRLAASYIQFPWRLVGVALCFLSMAGGYAVSRQWADARRFRAAGVLLAVSVLVSQHFLDGFYQHQDYYWTERDVNSMIEHQEYLYPETDRSIAWGRELPKGEHVQILSSVKNGLSVRFAYDAQKVKEQEGYADLPLFYYPGYHAVNADGSPLPVVRSGDGLARVLFAGGSTGEIHVFYRERRLWRLCEILSGGALGLFALLFVRDVRKKKDRYV